MSCLHGKQQQTTGEGLENSLVGILSGNEEFSKVIKFKFEIYVPMYFKFVSMFT